MRRSSPQLASGVARLLASGLAVLTLLLAALSSASLAASTTTTPSSAVEASGSQKEPPKDCGKIGTKKDDKIEGGTGKNVICGLGGDDVLIGGGGDDILRGGPGDDQLDGDAGNDDLYGGIGELDTCRQNKGHGTYGKCERPKELVEPDPGPDHGGNDNGSAFEACPLPTGAITDSFGDPRSGGRSHEGVDIIADKGDKIYAAISGKMENGHNELGGKTSYVRQSDGTFVYNAHLSEWAPEQKRVKAGDLVGYVGNTGNARGGVYHLHFEYHPNGGKAVDPYDDLKKACHHKAETTQASPESLGVEEAAA